MDQINFVKGALIGGCLAGLAAILLAPKSGQALRRDILDGYSSLNKGTKGYVNSLTDKAHQFMDYLNYLNEEHEDEEEGQHSHAFLIGGTSGAILGALAGLLLAPQSGAKLREYFGDEYGQMREKAKSIAKTFSRKEKNFEDKLQEWKDVFAIIIDKLSNLPKKERKANGAMDKILDLATLGMDLYNRAHRARR